MLLGSFSCGVFVPRDKAEPPSAPVQENPFDFASIFRREQIGDNVSNLTYEDYFHDDFVYEDNSANTYSGEEIVDRLDLIVSRFPSEQYRVAVKWAYYSNVEEPTVFNVSDTITLYRKYYVVVDSIGEDTTTLLGDTGTCQLRVIHSRKVNAWTLYRWKDGADIGFFHPLFDDSRRRDSGDEK